MQDVYVRQAVKDGDLLTNKILGKAFTDHADAYAGDCKMRLGHQGRAGQ